MVTFHIGQFFFMKDCPYQFPIFLYIISLYGVVFLVLFLNFWFHAYVRGQRLPKSHQNGKALQNGHVKDKGHWPRRKLPSCMGQWYCKLLDNQTYTGYQQTEYFCTYFSNKTSYLYFYCNLYGIVWRQNSVRSLLLFSKCTYIYLLLAH